MGKHDNNKAHRKIIEFLSLSLISGRKEIAFGANLEEFAALPFEMLQEHGVQFQI